MFKSNVDIKFSIQEADNFVQSLSWLVYDVWYILLLYNYYSLILELFWLCGIFFCDEKYVLYFFTASYQIMLNKGHHFNLKSFHI